MCEAQNRYGEAMLCEAQNRYGEAKRRDELE
jgi:hypothetical protein